MGYVSLSTCLVIKECIEVWVANFPPNNNSPNHTHPHHFLFSPTKWALMIKASKQFCVDLGKNACWPDQTEESIVQAISVGCKWGLRYSLVYLQLILKEIFQTSQIQAMMIFKNFYLRTLDVVVNVYTFCAIQNVVVNV